MTKIVNNNANCVTYETSKIQLADINEILKVAKNCFSEPWTYELFLSEITSSSSICIKVNYVRKIIAYIIGRYFVDELHIMHLAVLPEYRRKGIAKFLVKKLINDYSAEQYLLEVRASNVEAINLYKELGFMNTGIRKNYYSNGENAIVMSWRKENAR